ncbi:cytochrome P450 [Coprinellus micaceus]|uniref:Cytochrome P450 n=1 Tax=Coprinellus micaceus TaxID=71717 RepID=A0A4Y7TI45_COPMI|nr:cytochrome P450 [Coprinellus micaceus]
MATTTELLLTGAIAVVIYKLVSFYTVRSKISHIPTIGSDQFFLSYISAWKQLFDDGTLIKEGYYKYPGAAFKIPSLTTSSGWMVVVNGQKMVDELRKAPSDVLSFNAATDDSMQMPYVLGSHAYDDHFQIPVVRSPLTRAFPGRFSDIADEIVQSCATYLPTGSDFKALVAHPTLVHIVCRTTNRLFVGLPLCREPEYRKIQEDWTIQIVATSHLIHLFPTILKPVVAKLVATVRSNAKIVEKYLAPIILERLEKAKDGNDWEGKPNDLVQWLIDLAPPQHRNVTDITVKVMLINFAAIHTTSLTLANALFDLAARQEYIQPLRDEMQEVVGTHGWTKDGMGRMRKLDSFLKESSRLSGVGAMSLGRKATKDFTFSNGLTIPAGYTVVTSSIGVHTDPANYENPDDFDGFRFFNMRENGTDEYDPLRHQMVSLDTNYLLFGHGRHACPGRFFAVNEVKAMMAHILMNWDIKLPNDSTVVPEGTWFGGGRAPNTKAEILFRKRKVA